MKEVLKVKENIDGGNLLLENHAQFKNNQASPLFEMFRKEAKQNGYLKFTPQDNKRDFYLVASDEAKYLAPSDFQVYTIEEFEKACDSYWKSN